MKKAISATALILALALLPSCVVASAEDSSLTVANDSSYTIYSLYVTEIDNPDWGPDLLRGDVLFPGEEIVVLLSCDVYDVLVIDEYNVQCELRIDLCFDDALWVIDNPTLDSCAFSL